MKYRCEKCEWVGYEEDLNPESIYYEENQFVEESYPSKCPICHDSDKIQCIDEKEFYKI